MSEFSSVPDPVGPLPPEELLDPHVRARPEKMSASGTSVIMTPNGPYAPLFTVRENEMGKMFSVPTSTTVTSSSPPKRGRPRIRPKRPEDDDEVPVRGWLVASPWEIAGVDLYKPGGSRYDADMVEGNYSRRAAEDEAHGVIPPGTAARPPELVEVHKPLCHPLQRRSYVGVDWYFDRNRRWDAERRKNGVLLTLYQLFNSTHASLGRYFRHTQIPDSHEFVLKRWYRIEHARRSKAWADINGKVMYCPNCKHQMLNPGMMTYSAFRRGGVWSKAIVEGGVVRSRYAHFRHPLSLQVGSPPGVAHKADI
jgi:hypothetical protein